jgi:eukaryotic-like serine/threonine-protein kinase
MPPLALFDRMEIVRTIASGGMGEVLLVRHRQPDSDGSELALKRLFSHWAAEPAVIEMFQHEVKLLRWLSHPAVPQLIESGTDQGVPYALLEYISGADLERLRSAKVSLSPRASLELIRALLEALVHIHTAMHPDGRALNLVHRDVSPSNVIVRHDGSVKLVDFGVATSVDRTMTCSGSDAGTPGYLAPEVITGEGPVDARADLFAVGVILYELTTGTRLFPGSRLQALIAGAEARVRPPTQFVKSYPPAIESVLLRALAREPGARFNSAGDMLDALESAAHTSRCPPSREALITAVRAFGQR